MWTLPADGIKVPEVEGQSSQATGGSDMNRIVVGVDIAKRVFQLHWVEPQTVEMVALQLKRQRFLAHLPSGRTAVLTHSKAPPEWLSELLKRRPKNVAVVAVANKMARTIWALTDHERAY
jgi:hypothetical protein